MIRLVMLFSVASAFILYACWVLTAHGFDLDAANPLLSTYRLGFVVVVVGISLFPLTLVEGVSFAIAVLAAAVVNELNMGSAERLFLSLGHLWLMFVVAAVAVLASLSQTNFMAFLTERAAVDRLTGLLTREFGVELLDIQYQIAIRSKGELTLLLFDLDKFKAVNDTFGHPEGDRVLSATAASIRSTLRQQDIAIRWGGEEFLVVLPNTGEAGAAQVIARLARHGLTKRPNNEPQTASIGVVSTIEDSGGGWQQLVAIADQRLYIAKQNNRNCWVGSEGISNSFIGIPSLSA
ncbi:MAG: GGDEF domain-containing protein [Gammaproteobacteria bacterium]